MTNYEKYLGSIGKAADFIGSVCACHMCPVDDLCSDSFVGGTVTHKHCHTMLSNWLKEEATEEEPENWLRWW